MILRPMRDTAEDLEAVRLIATAAFESLRASLGEPPDPEPAPESIAREVALNRHFVRTDPGGCWLAFDEEGEPLGAALASKREGTWGLSLLVVSPAAQGKGVGRALLGRAVAYGADCPRGIISGSPDPRAARAYRGAGFTLHPAMRFKGTLDPAGLAAPDGPVLVGGPEHRELMDGVDRLKRGGAHGPDHDELLRRAGLLVADDEAGSGYCYFDRADGKVLTVVATTEQVGARLLTSALLRLDAGTTVTVANVTAEQEWAVDVLFAARLEVTAGAYVCLRGMRPPTAFVPSGMFL
ncbi:GNAT family N-acetyltransferase [Streptomyces sp. NBC_01304]|uniref:GNAT family N-acetyltransferase n=1 Tax=Streptomyces sp. NBC_01304 TaxID=2903818 RepID=UPI002E151506|nr:GNAT family N-acetyltransferase [Streptomyces sp. NBC_01304]